MKEKTFYIVVSILAIVIFSSGISGLIFITMNDYNSAIYCIGTTFLTTCLCFGIPLISPWGI